MDKELVAIKILHNSNNRIVFNLYAELFRLMGIYVGEGRISEYSIDEARLDVREYQLFLGICDGDIPDFSKYTEVNDQFVWINSNDSVYSGKTLNNLTENSEESSVIQNKMKDVIDSLYVKNQFAELMVLKEYILEIYLKKNVLKAACLLQFYRLKTGINKEAEEIFVTAYDEYRNVRFPENNSIAIKHLFYAKLYCRQKANLAIFYQSEDKKGYDVDKLSEECEDLITYFPEFSNLYVLLGMICENYEYTKIKAMNAYRAAINMIGEKSYASHVYYWLGVLCEKYSKNLPVAEEFYQDAMRLQPKYRNIYKVSNMLFQRGELDAAISSFEECISNIEKQKNFGLDPLEIEYYYKTCALICMICTRETGDYINAIKYGEKARGLYNSHLENDYKVFFKYYFGNEEKRYRDVSKGRIDIEKLKNALYIAYVQLEMTEEANSVSVWGTL